MIKVNIIYKDDAGQTIKTDQREVEVVFDMELTPEDLAAAEEAEKSVDDLVAEQVLTELATTLATAQLSPSTSTRFIALVPGEAMELPEPVVEPAEEEGATVTEAG